jgi:Rad51
MSCIHIERCFSAAAVHAALERLHTRAAGVVIPAAAAAAAAAATETQQQQQQQVVPQSNCRLVILDSATSALAPLLGGDATAQEHVTLSTLAHSLAHTAVALGVCVLVTNSMVSDRRVTHSNATVHTAATAGATDDDVNGAAAADYDEQGTVTWGRKPALGLAWTYAPSVRVVLHQQQLHVQQQPYQQQQQQQQQQQYTERWMLLDKHPAKACGGSAPFVIGPLGVADVAAAHAAVNAHMQPLTQQHAAAAGGSSRGGG